MITAPKVVIFLALILTILFGSLAINWIVFGIFKKIAARFSGDYRNNPHLSMTAPAIVAAIVNFLVWLVIFSIIF